MPYKLRKAPKRDLFWVVNKETGTKHSKEPLPKERAQAQMRALYAAESGAKMRGGMDGEEEGYRTPPRARSPAHAGPGRRAPSPPAARAQTAAERAAHDAAGVREAVQKLRDADEARRRLRVEVGMSPVVRARLTRMVTDPLRGYLPDIAERAMAEYRGDAPRIADPLAGRVRRRGEGAVCGMGKYKNMLDVIERKYFPTITKHDHGLPRDIYADAISAYVRTRDILDYLSMTHGTSTTNPESKALKDQALGAYEASLAELRAKLEAREKTAKDAEAMEEGARADERKRMLGTYRPGMAARAPAAAAPAPAARVETPTTLSRAALEAEPSYRKLGFGKRKEITMKPAAFFKEHGDLVTMLESVAAKLKGEAEDQAKEAKAVRKTLSGGGAPEAWAAYDALPERPSEEVSVRYVKAFPELGITESNMIRIYDASHRRPTPFVAKELIEAALLKKYGERPAVVGKGEHTLLAKSLMRLRANRAQYEEGKAKYAALLKEGKHKEAAEYGEKLAAYYDFMLGEEERYRKHILPKVA
jgi:hypothetical protein